MSINPRNTAIKRILADVRELNKHKTCRYHAVPLEDNLFEWHFTIRGPVGTDFEGGLYHGRILLAADYPFKPPNIVFTTKNGRFEVGTKICLSISAHHPEHWQPAWGVRTMLEAIISFLPSEGAGAIGALDWTPAERKKLAEESLAYICPICGPIKDTVPNVTDDENDVMDADIAAQISQLHVHGLGNVSEKASGEGGESSKIGAVAGLMTPGSSPSCSPAPSLKVAAAASIKEEEVLIVSDESDEGDGKSVRRSSGSGSGNSSGKASSTTTTTAAPLSPVRGGDSSGAVQELFQSPNTATATASETPPPPPPETINPETPLSIRAVRRRVLANRQQGGGLNDENINNFVNQELRYQQEQEQQQQQQHQPDWIDSLVGSILVVIGFIIIILLYRVISRHYHVYFLNNSFSKL